MISIYLIEYNISWDRQTSDHRAVPSKVHVFRVYKCTLHKMHNSGLKNPKKCNIWHLPAKFGSTVVWECMRLHLFVGGWAALAASAVQKL